MATCLLTEQMHSTSVTILQAPQLVPYIHTSLRIWRLNFCSVSDKQGKPIVCLQMLWCAWVQWWAKLNWKTVYILVKLFFSYIKRFTDLKSLLPFKFRPKLNSMRWFSHRRSPSPPGSHAMVSSVAACCVQSNYGARPTVNEDDSVVFRFLSLVTLTFDLWPWPSNSLQTNRRHWKHPPCYTVSND